MRTPETVSPKTVELLSRITGEKLEAKDVTLPVIFLAALISVLLGVMFADAKVTTEEKQRWQKTLNHFIPAEGNIRQLAQLLSKGIREQKTYANSDELLTLIMSLSESERLLLIGFGYEMSAADGVIDTSEKCHLRQMANLLGLKPSYLDVLESGFIQQSVLDLAALKEVKSLLDPARFHELDTLFVKAANDLLSTLPAATEEKTPDSKIASFDRLKEFQTSRKQLDSLCNQLHEITQSCSERSFLPNHLVEDVAKISCKLKSQRFRVAVVGEFSQGKSTLLNALLGEEIQPVRAVPCSGTITTLRHGDGKKVICHYKDGRQEEISVDEYKGKASIQKVSVVEQDSDKFATSEIEEIIFEHPDLDLCKSGVEILDSPGLNENPDRTAITEKLLKDIDAAIFLTNAARLLPEREKELIQDVRAQLTGSTDRLPADNLFVLVNFMDLLDNEQDRQDVMQRLEEFITEEKLIVANPNRVHYVSAKAALKGQDEYLKSFRGFTRAIEHFLTVERGAIEIKRFVSTIKDLSQMILAELQQSENLLDGKIKLSGSEVQEVLEKIGEASGRAVKVRILVEQALDLAIEETNKSWDTWIEELDARMIEKSEQWSSDHSALWSREQLVADYARQFNNDLSGELNDWIENHFKKTILQPPIEKLDNEIRKELRAIQSGVKDIDVLRQSQASSWVFSQDKNSDFGDAGDFGFAGSLGLAGLGVVAFIPVIIFAGPILAFVGSFFASGLLGTGVGGVLDIDAGIREKVFEKGGEQFIASLDKTFENISEIINTAFCERSEQVDVIVSRTISMYENLLEQQEKVHQKNVNQRETEKAWILQKRLELEELRFNAGV